MKKLAYGNGEVIVTLSPVEFSGLAGASYSGIADGTEISLVDIKKKLDLVNSKGTELAGIKADCLAIAQKLTDIGI